MEIKKETEEKLACSLTAETTELIPFLPYLLQDLWELGSNPRDMVKLIKKRMPISEHTKVLDIACGKGAVSIHIARELAVKVYGFDLMPDFIEYANNKARELNVGALCHFAVANANDVVNTEADYDCVIFGAAGNVLGNPSETLNNLRRTVKQGGFILIDECYLPGDSDSGNDDVKYKNYEYLTHGQWLRLFADSGLELVEEAPAAEAYDFDSDNKAIAARAAELTAKYPEKQEIFNQYLQSQLNECDDLENNLVGVTWMLRKKLF